jgi:hypothetical protein
MVELFKKVNRKVDGDIATLRDATKIWEAERTYLIEFITLETFGKAIGIPVDIINRLTGSDKQR